MNIWLIYGVGAIAQILFTGRSILQWILSEKQRKVLTPTGFWKMSLFASFLLFLYGYLRSDFAIMLGQALTYFIYIRNMQIQGEWKKMNILFRIFLYIFPILIVILGYNNNMYDLHNLLNNDDIPFWLLILGIIAQIIFTLRFVYQWIHSERQKKSILPMGFWILSFAGSLLIITYAVFRLDPILIVGHLFGIITYSRNIYFLRNESEVTHN